MHPRLISRNIPLLCGGIGICLGMLTCSMFSLGGKNDVESSTPQVNGNIQQSQMAIHHPVSSHPHESAAICAQAVDEEAYIDEWVDYHYALGFRKFYIYDNSLTHELRQWAANKGSHVFLKHHPEKGALNKFLTDCATTYGVANNHTWLAIFDIDEFLVIRKHRHVVDFLHEYAKEGALAINWFVFFNSGRVHYEPLPVTKRFLYRHAVLDDYVKIIVKLEHLNVTEPFWSPHHVPLKKDKKVIDTNGHAVKDAWNTDGPRDVVTLHHYHTKSRKEYIRKKMRGESSKGNKRQWSEAEDLVDEFLSSRGLNASIFDDSAWQLMKEIAPKYRVFDMF
jgi:hypothetical protein